MGELKRAKEQRVHKFSTQKLREKSQVQELQERMKILNDSGEFLILWLQVLQDRFQYILVYDILSQEMKIKIGAKFQCRHLQEGRRQ